MGQEMFDGEAQAMQNGMKYFMVKSSTPKVDLFIRTAADERAVRNVIGPGVNIEQITEETFNSEINARQSNEYHGDNLCLGYAVDPRKILDRNFKY